MTTQPDNTPQANGTGLQPLGTRLDHLGPAPTFVRLYGKDQEKTVRIVKKLSDAALFNERFSDDDRAFIQEMLSAAKDGKIPRSEVPRLKRLLGRVTLGKS